MIPLWIHCTTITSTSTSTIIVPIPVTIVIAIAVTFCSCSVFLALLKTIAIVANFVLPVNSTPSASF